MSVASGPNREISAVSRAEESGDASDSRLSGKFLASHIKRLLRSTNVGESTPLHNAPYNSNRESDTFSSSGSPGLDRSFEIEKGKISPDNHTRVSVGTHAKSPKSPNGDIFLNPDVMSTLDLHSSHGADSSIPKEAPSFLPTFQQLCAIGAELNERNNLLVMELETVREENTALRKLLTNAEVNASATEQRLRTAEQTKSRSDNDDRSRSQRERDQDADIVALTSKISTLQAQLEIVQGNLLSCRAEAWDAAQAALNIERSQLLVDKGRLRKELDSADALNRQLQEQLSRCTDEMERLRDRAREAAAASEGWEAKARLLEKAFSSLQGEGQAAASRLAERDALASRLADELRTAREAEDQWRQESVQAARQLAAVREEAESSRVQLCAAANREAARAARLEQRAQELEAECATASDRQLQLKAAHAELQARCAVLEGQAAAAQDELTRAREQLREATTERQQLRVECAGAEVAAQRRAQEQLAQCRQEAAARVKDAMARCERAEASAAARDAQMQALQADVEAAAARLAEQEGLIRRLRQEARQAGERAAEEAAQRARLRAELDGRSSVEAGLRQELMQLITQVLGIWMLCGRASYMTHSVSVRAGGGNAGGARRRTGTAGGASCAGGWQGAAGRATGAGRGARTGSCRGTAHGDGGAARGGRNKSSCSGAGGGCSSS